jgi:high-affinity Fe2+/Pb2+ permease
MLKTREVGLVKSILEKVFGRVISRMGSQMVKESTTAMRQIKMQGASGKMARW